MPSQKRNGKGRGKKLQSHCLVSEARHLVRVKKQKKNGEKQNMGGGGGEIQGRRTKTSTEALKKDSTVEKWGVTLLECRMEGLCPGFRESC